MEIFIMIVTLITVEGQYVTTAHMGEWESKAICEKAIWEVGDKMIKDPNLPWAFSVTNCINIENVDSSNQPPNV